MKNQSSSYHSSVLLHESIEALNIKPNGVYVDVTFGGGGHSKAILEQLGRKGKLIAFDHDADAWKNKIEDARFHLVKENFRYVRQFLKYLGEEKVDGILADLGVSSYQFDTADRGFSIRFEGGLDMRMDQRMEKTAADLINEMSEGELHKMFEKYGEVRNAKTLAATIVGQRSKVKIDRIEAFKNAIKDCIKGNPNRYLAQVFQALRIELNQEMQVLETFLENAAQSLKKDGILAVITFHSLEDKIVKQFFRNGGMMEVEKDEFGRWIGEKSLKQLKDVLPSEEELKLNNRSRSARLRTAQKL